MIDCRFVGVGVLFAVVGVVVVDDGGGGDVSVVVVVVVVDVAGVVELYIFLYCCCQG